jgi:hypothetical protein
MVVLVLIFLIFHFCNLVVRGAAVTLRVQVLHLLELVAKVVLVAGVAEGVRELLPVGVVMEAMEWSLYFLGKLL